MFSMGQCVPIKPECSTRVRGGKRVTYTRKGAVLLSSGIETCTWLGVVECPDATNIASHFAHLQEGLALPGTQPTQSCFLILSGEVKAFSYPFFGPRLFSISKNHLKGQFFANKTKTLFTISSFFFKQKVSVLAFVSEIFNILKE